MGGGPARIFRLKGDGDFRSEECIDILKQADIIVTNPPFSLIHEYFAQLNKFEKKFIILRPMTAYKSKDNFPFFQNFTTWFGVYRGAFSFAVPGSDDLKTFGNVCWYTNLDHQKRPEKLRLYRTYDPDEYQKYDNYNAIEVGKVADIPKDYHDYMGVPLSIMMKISSGQFEIQGKVNRKAKHPLKTKVYTPSDCKEYNDLNGSAVIRDSKGELKAKFERIFVRNLAPEEPESDRS